MMANRESTRSQAFKRGYVACNSCRLRKVRCILEGEPPCTKCKREFRVCQFDHRSKTRKHRDPPRWAASGNVPNAAAKSSEATTSRERPEAYQDLLCVTGSQTSARDLPVSSSQGDQAHPGQIPPIVSNECRDTFDLPVTPQTPGSSLSDRVVSTIVTGSNDALHVLSDVVNSQRTALTPTSFQTNSTKSQDTALDLPRVVPTDGQPGCQSGMGFSILDLSEPDEATLDLWDKCRFVRQGFFTGQEAVSYVDCFFKYLAPLSAITLEQFRPHTAHHHLIYEEPVLCCTLLVISSRFFMLPGAGGASRSHFIHNRLWHYTEFLIKRVVFGQEKFSVAKTRNLGTIESLMLISEWHPRALHFPPETEGWDGLLISTDDDSWDRTRKNNEEPSARWRHDVFEPAKRAHRMSWMLLGIATNLAHELGVFSKDKNSSLPSSDGDICRRHRVRRLLYAHVTQTATRLGYQSIFPEIIAIDASYPLSDEKHSSSERAWSAYMNSWTELTRLHRLAFSMFFSSIVHLQHQLMNDTYRDLLESFSASLATWKLSFDSTCQDVSPGIRTTLLIEYHHLKACAGAVSIQAVVQRALMFSATGHRRESLATFLTPHDKKYLQEVISDSTLVLELATMTDFRSQLPLAPARTRISVISASVFLLKAVSVGDTDTDAEKALDTLEKSTKALRDLPPDDMDFAMRYATLIDKFTATFRASLNRTRPPLTNTGEYAGPYRSVSSFPEEHTGTPELSAGPSVSVHGQNMDGEGGMDFEFATASQNDPWRTMPFDPSIAPFGAGFDQLSQGLDLDSLNFLWNLPDLG